MYGTVGQARKRPPDALIVAPTRWGWVSGAADTTQRLILLPTQPREREPLDPNEPPRPDPSGTWASLDVYVSGAMPTNLGAGTNEDRVIVVRSRDLLVFESTPRFLVMEQQKADTLEVVLRLHS
jgi:hypothetical protein